MCLLINFQQDFSLYINNIIVKSVKQYVFFSCDSLKHTFFFFLPTLNLRREKIQTLILNRLCTLEIKAVPTCSSCMRPNLFR